MSSRLHQELLDLFSIKAASGAAYMEVDDVLVAMSDKLSVSIDRDTLMNLIDLDQLKMVKSIDGNRVMFNVVKSVAQSSADAIESGKQNIIKSATNQASKRLTK